MRIGTDVRGFTLVELMVATVLGGLVLAAIYQILISNQRTFGAQNAEIRSRQTLRGGMHVLFSELREISPEEGDIVTMADQALHVRVGRSMGLVCSFVTSGSNPVVQVMKLGRFLVEDSARVFYENNPMLSDDDEWRTAQVDLLDTSGTLTCPDGTTAQEVKLNGVEYGAPPDSILTGALVRNLAHYRYELGTYDDRSYLVRVDGGGNSTPVMGPLDATEGLEFRYLDEDGASTTVPVDVRQIEVTLRTISPVRDAHGEPLRDSMTTRIYTRNSSH